MQRSRFENRVAIVLLVVLLLVLVLSVVTGVRGMAVC
jgi:hypothetical protein